MNAILRQAASNCERQLLAPARDFAAPLQGLGSTRRFTRAKHRNQIERSLLSAIEAKVSCTGIVQHMSQWPGMPAFDVLLDPVIDAHMIEPVARLGKVSVGGGKTDLL